MRRQQRVVTVFGSSRPRAGDEHYDEARALGAALAVKGFTVCSGGYAGVMEAVSRGAKEAGGKTLGVTAAHFARSPNEWIDEEIRVKTWQERLFELVRQGDGYVACRGGTGTLVELAVVWEMLSKGVMRDRPLVAVGDFWRPIVERVREVDFASRSPNGEGAERYVQFAASPADAANYLFARVKARTP